MTTENPQQGGFFTLYESLVIKKPLITLLLAFALIGFLASKIPQLRLDASADTLVLEGDEALQYFRETSKRYASEDYLVITFTPKEGVFTEAGLQKLTALKADLAKLERVSSISSILDVPLLQSPPVTFTQVAEGDLKTVKDPGVDFDLVKKEFVESPLYKNLLTSPDNTTTALQVNLKRDEKYFELLAARENLYALAASQPLNTEQKQELKNAEKAFQDYSEFATERQSQLVDAVRSILDQYRGEDQLYLGGVPMIAADMISFIEADIRTFGLALMGFMVLMLAIIFRGLRWIIVPLTTCAAVIVTVSGLLAWIEWPLTVISSNFVALLLIITLSISIHLIVRYRELAEALPNVSQQELVSKTASFMAKPCIYTALTTIVAFASLVVSGIRPVVNFGWMLTMGVTIALVFAFVLLPAMLSLLPRRAADAETAGVAFTHRFAKATEHYGNLILIACVVLCGLSVWGVSQLKVENRFIDYFQKDTEIYQGMELIDAKLGGTIPLEIIIDDTKPVNDEALAFVSSEPVAADDVEAGDDFFEEEEDDFFAEDFSDDFADVEGAETSVWFTTSGMRRIESVHDYLEELPETGKVLSLATLYKVIQQISDGAVDDIQLALVQQKLPESVNKTLVDPYLQEDIDQARITVRVMETSRSLQRNELLKKIKHDLVHELGFEEEQVNLTGMLVMYNNMLQSLYRSQILTLGVVFLCIMVMFMILFRSFWLAIIAITPNILAASIVLGGMGLAGIPLDIMTVTIAAITVGIGVDDTIHYVHRFKTEFAKDGDYLASMYRCHDSIGKAMYYTSLTIIIGFSILALSNFIPSIYFGLLTGLAMFTALMGALLLLPKLLVTFKPLGQPRNN